MKKQKSTGANLQSLMDTLASKDGMARQAARIALVELGNPAVSSLVRALQNSKSRQVRWEAAKALGEIGDAGSIPGLVKALEDKDADVAWLAADALRQFKKTAWPPLLQALMKNGSDSIALRQGVHHALLKQKEEGYNDLLATLMNALESAAAAESTPVAANALLRKMEADS